MEFDVYCDESHPDLLCSNNPPAQFMIIGSLWLATSDRSNFKAEIHNLRNQYKVGGEFKWRKVSPSRYEFYKELTNWFFNQGDRLRFRCIVVDRKEVNLIKFHRNDQELGFYKFYYQMLHHWILDYNEYSIFCDYKSNRERNRLPVLKRCLGASNIVSQITSVQATRSKDSVLLQLSDLLTGAVSAKFNKSMQADSAKANLISQIESKISIAIRHTGKSEQKFNVFVINLHGGW